MAAAETPPTDQTDQPANDTDSLETPEGETPSANNQSAAPAAAADSSAPPTGGLAPKSKRFGRLKQSFNVYLVLFVFIIILAGVVIAVAYLQSRQSVQPSHLQTQSLSQSTLNQLANSDATVGSNQTVLNVQSSAVFAGQVLIRQGLQVAGNLQVGGTLALNNITVSGTGQFGQASVGRDLAVTGDTAIQGAETIGKSLQVNGNGTFSGPLSAPQITTPSLQLTGDLVLTRHITIGGSTPGRSNGSALGGGGTVSVSGSDTAGAISINTGSSPPAGCFVTITFSSAFASTPYVQVTPIGSAGAGLAYYVNRSTTSFSVCTASAPPSGSSFGFDYFIVD